MYAIEHNDNAFTPDGKADISDVSTHNAEVERREIEWLRTGPERVFLYVRIEDPDIAATPGMFAAAHFEQARGECVVTTWPGTVVSSQCYIGPRRNIGFGYHSYRRAITARIFGTLYHGWYFESSGSYCRLKRAKRQ